MQTNPSKGLLTILGNSMTGVNKYDKFAYCGHIVLRELENNGLIILTMENTHPSFHPPSTIEYQIQGRTTPCLLRPPRNPFHLAPQNI